MTPVPVPATRLAYASDQPSRREFRARPSQQFVYIHGINAAAHVASLGYEVETIINQGRVGWRAPAAARAALKRYSETLNALDSGRKRAAEAMASKVTDHAAS